MTNTQWPDTVPILSVFQTISQQYGDPYEDGYPVDVIGWVEYSFPNHANRIDFWNMHYRVYALFERDRKHILSLIGIDTELDHIARWNTRVLAIWNTVMALLGYTENQSDRTLRVYEYIKSNSFFQKLEVVVGCRNGIYYPITYYHNGEVISMNRVVTINRKEFNAEEETIETRSDFNRSTNTTRSIPKTRSNRPSRIKPTTIHKGNPALRRLMQADGA